MVARSLGRGEFSAKDGGQRPRPPPNVAQLRPETARFDMVRYSFGVPEISRLPEGFLLDERYRIGNLLSVGGMGAVYEASHTLLQKPVAIKVLRTDLPSSDLMIDRFRREAIAASAIGHENIVQVTDMGITHDGTAYLVMELLHGRNLGDAIRAEAPFAIERSCRIAVDILRGVGAAHE